MPNRLIREKSPYLLQHAHNPVDWYPWGDEAFGRARAGEKPIFLSIGYSTCHWCHVMERESFESAGTAAFLNEHFVCIKVDREERPDVDRVYMSALHAMGENGGWPLSMFLTPDLHPFYGGTYYPPENRYGRIGFPELLRRIHEVWTTRREEVAGSAGELTQRLRESAPSGAHGDLPDPAVQERLLDLFRRTYDQTHGGFGGAPKFPRPSVFEFLLRAFRFRKSPEALEMTTASLRRMAEGGIYDQLGGGFHRYAVDAQWRVPHFEKMLYDQAQLVSVLADVFLLTRDPFFERIALETLDYVAHMLTHPQGGFYSAEDADSVRPEAPAEKGEGAFYIWSKAEIMGLLGDPDGRLFCEHYGVLEEGNALTDPHGEFPGKNILYVAGPLNAIAAPALERARTLLRLEREKRPRPLLDDKVLTSWNGLMIGAAARAYRAFRREADLSAAIRAAEFVLSRLRDPDSGRLLRRWRAGEARHQAHLEDYAFLCHGLLELYEVSFEARWLRTALELTRTQIALFGGEGDGAFFDTSGEDPSILVRTRELYDGAEPSGNAMAASNLLRLGRITGDRTLEKRGEAVIAAAGRLLTAQAHAVPRMAAALYHATERQKDIVIVGGRGEERTEALLGVVAARYLPEAVVLLSVGEELADIAPFAASLARQAPAPAAYLCEGQTCRLPVTEPAALAAELDRR